MVVGVILLIVSLLMMTGVLGSDFALKSTVSGVSGVIAFIFGIVLLGVGVIWAEFIKSTPVAPATPPKASP